ncbi:MAG: hypothetical protein QF464_10610 [Myxococcota bacterium]|nr:hypothetical protein [Myxococcota bacterium]
MVPIGPGLRLCVPLLLASVLVGCAGQAAEIEAARQRAICRLTTVAGRLDLVPAGPGALGARLVTLDRQGALATLRTLDDDLPTGLVKVRVEAPRPLLAVVLRVAPSAGALVGTIPLRHPITLAVDRSTEDIEELEAWIGGQGGSLLRIDGPPTDAMPPGLPSDLGLDARPVEDLVALFAHAVAMAEELGAVWVYGRLEHRTLAALDRVLREHGEEVHVVVAERLTRPPTTTIWRRRCPN